MSYIQVKQELIRLIEKIAQSEKPVGIEINYDGHKFRWQLKLSNITASEYNPIGKKELGAVRTLKELGVPVGPAEAKCLRAASCARITGDPAAEACRFCNLRQAG